MKKQINLHLMQQHSTACRLSADLCAAAGFKRLLKKSETVAAAVFKCCLISVLILFAFSCKTAPQAGIQEPFGIIGDNADVYAYIPVKGNADLLEEIFPSPYKDAAKKALARTSAVYAGIFVKEPYVEMQLCLKGQYPAGLSGLFFKRSGGWQHHKTEEGYKYYSSEYMDISIPSASMICASFGLNPRTDVKKILSMIKNPVQPIFSREFDYFIRQNNTDNKIGVFVKNTNFFFTKVAGVELNLPIEKIEMYFERNKIPSSESYTYNLNIEAKNMNAGFATRLLLSKLLKADVRIIGNTIIVENGYILVKKLAAVIKSLYH